MKSRPIQCTFASETQSTNKIKNPGGNGQWHMEGVPGAKPPTPFPSDHPLLKAELRPNVMDPLMSSGGPRSEDLLFPCHPLSTPSPFSINWRITGYATGSGK